MKKRVSNLLMSALTLTSVIGISMAQDIIPLRRTQKVISPSVENFYTQSLDYLASSQGNNGAWREDDAPGSVAFCTLAMLAYGDDANHGKYAKNIHNSIGYLLSSQSSNGYIGSALQSEGHASMYNHGFATLALAEAYGMVDNEKIGPALKAAVNLILSAQKRNPKGGWRYSPDATDADSTVAGCQIVALFAARNAGIPVPEAAFKKGLEYLDSCRDPNSGGYGYINNNGRLKVTLTAIGVLCDCLAKRTDTEEFALSLSYLKRHLNFRDPVHPYYFEYYMSQALFHADQKEWEKWNKQNIKYLSAIQAPDGSINSNFGAPYSTGASMLSFALNYRFLPIYEK